VHASVRASVHASVLHARLVSLCPEELQQIRATAMLLPCSPLSLEHA